MNLSLPLLVLGGAGLVLVAEALRSRYEVLAYTAGWRTPTGRLPAGMTYATGAGPEHPTAYLVYLDGIGKRRFRDSRDSGRMLRALVTAAPDLRVLGQVLPYSPLAEPLADRPLWARLRGRAGVLLFAHNVMQVFVAADHRYRPLYNTAIGRQIATQLLLAGYRAGSGVPVVLLSYSGGAQVATGALGELRSRLGGPMLVITVGGFHNGANPLTEADHLHQVSSARDWIERAGMCLFPQRWPLVGPGAWNRARRAGKVTVHRFDEATHVGPSGYFSAGAVSPDGRSHLDRTVDTVIGLIRARYAAPNPEGHTNSSDRY